MANNLFISYDLHSPGQKYAQVEQAIKALGGWAKIHYSLWYVNSGYTAQQAAEHVWNAMDGNDRLIVVNASGNDASWYNLTPEVSQFLQDNWPR